jgi:hypothetical protein
MMLTELPPSVSLQDAEKKQNRRTLGEALKHWQAQGPQCWVLLFEPTDENPFFQGNGSLFLLTCINEAGPLVASIEMGNMGLVEGVRFLLQGGACVAFVAHEDR